MLITRKSPFSGITRSMELPISQAQWDDWDSGTLIQKAMPHLDADQREFIMTGTTQEEWDNAFGKSDND